MNTKKRRKYNIGKSSDLSTTPIELCDEEWFCNLCKVNETIDSASDINELKVRNIRLPSDIFHRWLWGSDPTERPHGQCLLNFNHLIGLLIVRYTAIYSEIDDDIQCEIIDKPVKDLTLRQLRDVVHYLQCEFNKKDSVNDVHIKLLLNTCMHRFGTLTLTGGESEIMDEISCIDSLVGNQNYFKINLVCIRRFLCIFLILHRHIYISENAKKVPSYQDRMDAKILTHHIAGSEDHFIKLAYHYSIMPAAKLNYMHEFGQMFHNVSQVAYFHNPNFRLPVRCHDLEKINSGDLEYLHVVPSFLQLYPEIEILYEETDKNITKGMGRFYLFHMGKKIYLVDPTGNIFECHENPMNLLKFYVSMSS